MKKSFVWMGFILLFLAACNASSQKTKVVSSEVLPETEGELLYLDMKCPACHGYQGMGDGFLSEGLYPKPVDFTSAEAMVSITDAQLTGAIRKGKGIGMPAYPQFSDSQVEALVRHIRTFSQPSSN